MLTAQMPALAQALAGTLPPAALQQLMQALGNCQQSLAHRGAVSIAPTFGTQANGLAVPGTWRPSDYPGILPTAGSGGRVDIPGTGGGLSAAANGGDTYDPVFSFPISVDFTTRNYYGGDTFNVAGNSLFDASTHTSLTTKICNATELNVTYINGQQLPPPGSGADGIDGGPGGGFGGAGAVGGPIFMPGGPTPGPFLPGRPDVKSIVTNVRAGKAKAKVPQVQAVSTPEAGLTTDVKFSQVPYYVLSEGTVTVPVAQSGTLSSLTATGDLTFPTVTGASISGITASFSGGNISVPTSAALSGLTATCSSSASIPDKATISGIAASSSAVTFAIPTSVTLPAFTGKSSSFNVPTSVAVGYTGSATVTINEVTGGYLDASCNLHLTTQTKTYPVTLPLFTGTFSFGTVTPTITVTPSGTATLATTNTSVTPTISITNQGTVSLSASAPTTINGDVSVTNFGKITLTPASQTVTGSVSITNQGTVSLTPGNTTRPVSLSAADAILNLTTKPTDIKLETTGTVLVDKVSKVTVDKGQQMTLTPDTADVEIPIDPALRVNKDFLVYYRPRF